MILTVWKIFVAFVVSIVEHIAVNLHSMNYLLAWNNHLLFKTTVGFFSRCCYLLAIVCVYIPYPTAYTRMNNTCICMHERRKTYIRRYFRYGCMWVAGGISYASYIAALHTYICIWRYFTHIANQSNHFFRTVKFNPAKLH